MKIDEVRKRAFAMPLTSPAELLPAAEFERLAEDAMQLLPG
jgi:acetoacetate decarboxylase